MLNELITRKKNQWLRSDNCPINTLSTYIRKRGYLREPQVEAIETYLYLKIEGGNKPLWELFSENFFTSDIDLNRLNINQETRKFLQKNTDALALYDLSSQRQGDGKSLLPELEKLITDDPSALDYQRIIKDIFYKVSYADYLMSLPMGAGKTFLMAAIIYLDLYFAENEPDNPAFAHNFLVLIPSGLKSSIAPSLRTIENFDPEWVIPEPAAGQIKRQLSFEILDEQKSAKRSNRVRNPNVQKVSHCFPAPYANVFIVNAEKVILDRLEEINGHQTRDYIGKSDDERDRAANELRNLIGKIPHLSLLIDEVHHAATDEIKLRQVVNRWQQGGNITTVLGFSGTPFLSSADRVDVNETTQVRFSRITNTVYYYPLIDAINAFLKKPEVKIARGIKDRLEIIRLGIADFQERFGNKRYANGSIAKLAIYCSNIETLEEQVYPFLTGELKIPSDEILKFHGGNKAYPKPPGSELAFRSLDFAAPYASGKRYILLVQIGKEGWDCRSLTGIILSQLGDCRRNMVLQTSCRCLRQVDLDATNKEEALIWLNDGNAKILNGQLKQQQHTSIEEINQAGSGGGEEQVKRHARMEQLKLPSLDFYQLKVHYQTVIQSEAQTLTRLRELCETLDDYHGVTTVTTTDFTDMEHGKLRIGESDTGQPAGFNQWLNHIAKSCFHKITTDALHEYEECLRTIFNGITLTGQGTCLWNDHYDREAIESRIRLAFSPRRELVTRDEVIPETVELLLVNKLGPTSRHDKLYPGAADTEKILKFDKHPPEAMTEQRRQQILALIDGLRQNNLDTSHVEQQLHEKHSIAVEQRDKSFHYLPYDFIQSGFEMELLCTVLSLEKFRKNPLEIYYNGERGLTGFVVECFQKKGQSWQSIGRYTTDFLLIQRAPDNKTIHKVLMIETKGGAYAGDSDFRRKKAFIESRFLEQNNRQFGYDRFDFLYLEDSAGINRNMYKLNDRINSFFGLQHAG